MADDENSVPVSIGFSMTAIISPCPKCCIWQVCIRKRKYPASEGGVFITGSQNTEYWIQKESGGWEGGGWGVSTALHTLELSHKGHHEKSYQ